MCLQVRAAEGVRCRLDSYYREQHVRQCYPGRTGVSESSCVIFFSRAKRLTNNVCIRRRHLKRPQFTGIVWIFSKQEEAVRAVLCVCTDPHGCVSVQNSSSHGDQKPPLPLMLDILVGFWDKWVKVGRKQSGRACLRNRIRAILGVA